MIINTEGVEVEQGERVYIKQEGEITLKVVKVTEGISTNNYKQIKVHFQDKTGRFAIDDFVITQNALWKVKIFTKALKLPNMVDTDLFINRYVKATFKAKNTPNGGVIYEIKKYEASPLTNTYTAPTPQQYDATQYNQNNQNTQHQQNHQEPLPNANDIDEDEIPF